MRAALRYIALAAALTAFSFSCGRRERIIPRGEMAEIYAEMFVLDQKIVQEPDVRRMADTLLVYEPVFEAYGYTSDDYRASMAYYIKDPDRYVRILKKTVEILESRRKELKAEKEVLESISQSKAVTESFRPERIFFLSGMANKDLLTVDSLVFYIDSTGGSYDFDVQKGYDTLYAGPCLVIPSGTESVPDTIAVQSAAQESAVESAALRPQLPQGRMSASGPGAEDIRASDLPVHSAQPLKKIATDHK